MMTGQRDLTIKHILGSEIYQFNTYWAERFINSTHIGQRDLAIQHILGREI